MSCGRDSDRPTQPPQGRTFGTARRPGQETTSADCRQEQETRLGWTEVLSSRLVLPAILLLALILYASTLGDWFSGDDFWFLRSSQATPVGEYVAKAFDFRQTARLSELDRYRPLYPVAWRLTYAVFGLNAWGYHALLLALHLGSTVLVWFIAFRLTRRPWAASLAALIFSIHPAYADAVAWISGGNRVFVTFPYLLSLLLFMRYVDGAARRRAYYLGSFLAFVTAILFHSAALTLAVVLPAYAFLVGGTPQEALRPRSWFPLAPFAVVAIALLGIQVWVRAHLGVEEQFRFGWHQYSNYGNYLGMALFPVFALDTERLMEPLPRLLEGLEGIASVAMILLSVALLTQRRWPHLGVFVVVWFYVSLLPDSTLRFTTMGRVLYMPGAALAIFFVAAVLWLKETLPASFLRLGTRAAPFLLMAILVPTAFLTVHHAQRYGQKAAENETFIAQLRESVPSMDAEGILYVVNAPMNLVAFDDTRLDALVELYYGEIEVRSLSLAQAAQVEVSLGEKDQIFRFSP
jgi:hypothetical protein